MGFNGYFVKIGDYEVPLDYMKTSTYKAYKTPIVLSEYQDADGKTHRDVLEHAPYTVEFDTAFITSEQKFDVFMGNIERNFINELDRKVVVTAYVPEKRDYITQEMRIPEIIPPVYANLNDTLQYDSFHLAFIGY